ncbi:MAG: chitobiase/beta-hexosaminidase C-terminal domain-containing protein [Treponema sp.]|nr:chitobiase/beta-hexosaminidase C-terminal domain-containing protein [Treponema sp.]
MLRRQSVFFFILFNAILRGFCQIPSALPSSSSFSERDIISPAPGTWGNRQPLVVNVPDGYEVYYSISGSDPLLFGFAYDGPSLIDKEGDVHLKITAVDRTGRRFDCGVDYTVKKASRQGIAGSWSTEQKRFVDAIAANPLRKYTAGSVFSIPEGFSYSCRGSDSLVLSAGDGAPVPYPDGRFFAGGLLSLGTESNIVRIVPFVVTDGETFFRFIVRTVPAKVERGEARQMPFVISDWDTVMPQDAAYLYKLDDGEWQGRLSPIHLDRSETHVLFWKPVDAMSSEKTESIVLYPKPALLCSYRDDGSISFSLSLSLPYLKNYKLGRAENPSYGLYERMIMDAFPGEDVSGNFTVGVYLDSVYQGKLSASYKLDRLPPKAPVITADESSGVGDFSDGLKVRIEGSLVQGFSILQASFLHQLIQQCPPLSLRSLMETGFFCLPAGKGRQFIGL